MHAIQTNPSQCKLNTPSASQRPDQAFKKKKKRKAWNRDGGNKNNWIKGDGINQGELFHGVIHPERQKSKKK